MRLKMRSSLSLLLAGTLAAACLPLSGCSFFPTEEDVLAPPLVEPKEIEYETRVVERKAIVNSVEVKGSFVSATQQDLAFQERSGVLAERNVSVGSKVQKGQLLARLDTDDLEYQIAQQRLVVRRAQIAYDDATGAHAIELAKIDLQMAQLQLDAYLLEFEKCSLYAPCDGEVIYVATDNIGDTIQAGVTFVRIADPTDLQVSYSGNKSAEFKVGAPVTVTYKNQEYEGEVVMDPSQLPVDAREEMKNTVRIALDSLPEEASIGGVANIELVLEEKEDAIVIPASLLDDYSNTYYVQVLEDGVKKERVVEVGIQSATEVEIVSGLEVGEEIIVR